jgi:uncharacterized membrane protein YdbT with pleckstrin-like domain
MITIQPDERVILEAHRHWLALLRNIIMSIFLVILPFVIFSVLNKIGIPVVELGLLPLFVFLTSAWAFVIWIFFYVAWTDYYLDILVLTDKRLIDVEQRGLFSREVSELRIENIQDATVQVNGLLETLLDLGSIHVQTAASSREFVIKHVPHPSKVKDIILGHYDKMKDK